MARYVDGFVVPVPKDKVGDYRRPARRDRDRVRKRVMADPGLADMAASKSLPFDAKRTFWGGFKVEVSA